MKSKSAKGKQKVQEEGTVSTGQYVACIVLTCLRVIFRDDDDDDEPHQLLEKPHDFIYLVKCRTSNNHCVWVSPCKNKGVTSLVSNEWWSNLNSCHIDFGTKVINAAVFNQVNTVYEFTQYKNWKMKQLTHAPKIGGLQGGLGNKNFTWYYLCYLLTM